MRQIIDLIRETTIYLGNLLRKHPVSPKPGPSRWHAKRIAYAAALMWIHSRHRTPLLLPNKDLAQVTSTDSLSTGLIGQPSEPSPLPWKSIARRHWRPLHVAQVSVVLCTHEMRETRARKIRRRPF